MSQIYCAQRHSNNGRKRRIEAEAGAAHKRRRVRTKVYMDDHSVVAALPEAMVEGVMLWQGWSTKVGLKENKSKKQLVANGEDARKKLDEALRKVGLDDWK